VKGRTLGLLMVTVTAFSWGLNWPVLKFVVGEWPPFTFRFLSGLGGAGLMFALAALRRERLLLQRGQWGRLALAGILNVTSFAGLGTLALLWLDASEAAIIAYTMPIWAALLAWPVLGERPTPGRIAGLVCGLGGVGVLLGGQLLAAPPAALEAKLPGIACILGTALMFATGAVLTKRSPLNVPPATNVAWQILFGSAPLMLVALLFDRWDLGRITPLGWAALVYVVVIALSLSYVTWFRGLKLLEASTAAIATLMVPVIGVISSGWLLGEPLGPRQVLALCLTVGGVALASRG
jgi:probable blue pigment (indigoidine) exporter